MLECLNAREESLVQFVRFFNISRLLQIADVVHKRLGGVLSVGGKEERRKTAISD